MGDGDFNLVRRSSGGVLLSPEVDVSSTSKTVPGETNESDGFYLLKKDSQRRQTLSKVLTQDEEKICKVWMEKIENDRPEKILLTIVSFLSIFNDTLSLHKASKDYLKLSKVVSSSKGFFKAPKASLKLQKLL